MNKEKIKAVENHLQKLRGLCFGSRYDPSEFFVNKMVEGHLISLLEQLKNEKKPYSNYDEEYIKKQYDEALRYGIRSGIEVLMGLVRAHRSGNMNPCQALSADAHESAAQFLCELLDKSKSGAITTYKGKQND